MYPYVLSPQTTKVIIALSGVKGISDFYLSGGTGLALQLGHRESDDLDFFTPQPFNPTSLQKVLMGVGVMSETYLEENTLNTFLNGVKLQFLCYPYPLLENVIKWEGVSISSLVDIACTKIITLSMRGSKKDFVDLFFLLHHFSLDKLLSKVDQKYAGIDYNPAHLLKSLVYFEDAESQPMPRMHEVVYWEAIKKEITQTVKKYRF